MRDTLIETMKAKIETSLRNYLREEGIELYIAANDNGRPKLLKSSEHVIIESISDTAIGDLRLLTEIKIRLGIMGKPAHCDLLVNGIYQALQPHHITGDELSVILMSLHIEAVHCVRPRLTYKCTSLRYIVEKTDVPVSTFPYRWEYAMEEKSAADTMETCSE